MSVIAKMTVTSSGQFANGSQVRFSCVYDADLANASNEDIRFTKASPWGEATATMSNPMIEGSQWYLFFHEITDEPSFKDCYYALRLRCHVVHDYGTSKQVEVSTAYSQDGVPEFKLTERSKYPPFHLKMTIDNPLASIQFVPNREYFLTMYSATRFTMDEAIARARG